MSRKGKVYFREEFAGILSKIEDEYVFIYDTDYLKNEKAPPVSLTLPKSPIAYRSKILFPFFDGLIPEGWLLNIVEKNWKLDARDRMGLLLVACGDCIGAVKIDLMEESQ